LTPWPDSRKTAIAATPGALDSAKMGSAAALLLSAVLRLRHCGEQGGRRAALVRAAAAAAAALAGLRAAAPLAAAARRSSIAALPGGRRQVEFLKNQFGARKSKSKQ
jgi:hypothetical protein